ncbi:MAG: hypothetical protein H6729_14285 [Deltaproteobacteria bacterium]|nr:hypothetical protein [Deltaproteobacteria bacterium]
MRTLDALMQASRDRGGHPVFYFVYSGHGDVENNEGYVTLQDSKFRRSDLLALLRTSSATTQHVIVSTYRLLFSRVSSGRSGDREPPQADISCSPMRACRQLQIHATLVVGFIDNHEWEAFQGGIFSLQF